MNEHGVAVSQRPARSLRAEAAFRECLSAAGATLLEPEWLGAGKPHRVRCVAGHDCYPYPTNVVRGIGPCRTCAGKDPVVAEAAFRRRLAELDAELLEPKYLGSKRPHHVRCANGHDCWPAPTQLSQGTGICRKCAHQQIDSLLSRGAEARFLARLAVLGATPLYGEWLGAKERHAVRCAAGHDGQPVPSRVNSGGGVCCICSPGGRTSAEAAFLARLEEIGAIPQYEEWAGVHTPLPLRCRQGHECRPRPRDVLRGRGPCNTCAGRDPKVAEAKFLAALQRLGAAPLYEKWLGARTRHPVRCAAGHDTWTSPGNVQNGNGICAICAGNDFGRGEQGFLKRVADLGGTPLYAEFLGSSRPHPVRCAMGHDCRPVPSNVKQGQGICRRCAGRNWDAFYVVTSRLVVKFGITSGDPSPRLSRHARHGYTNVIRIVPGLPGTVAPATEHAVRSALALAGEIPVRGKEYFDLSCLGLIVDVADAYANYGSRI